jgi:hypothetical protein
MINTDPVIGFRFIMPLLLYFFMGFSGFTGYGQIIALFVKIRPDSTFSHEFLYNKYMIYISTPERIKIINNYTFTDPCLTS